MWRSIRPRGNRPNGPLVINKSSVQAIGLVAAFDSQPSGARDVVSGLELSGTVQPVGSTLGGHGLLFNSANAGMSIATPSYLQLPFPITLDAWVMSVGTLGGGACSVGGVVYDPTGSGTSAYSLGGFLASGRFNLNYNDGSVFLAITSSVTATQGQVYHLCGVLDQHEQSLYIDGALAIQTTAATAFASPAYNTNTTVGIGELAPASGVTSNVQVMSLRIWNRYFSAGDAYALYDPATRWDLYSGVRSPMFWPATAAAAPRLLLVKN